MWERRVVTPQDCCQMLVSLWQCSLPEYSCEVKNLSSILGNFSSSTIHTKIGVDFHTSNLKGYWKNLEQYGT